MRNSPRVWSLGRRLAGDLIGAQLARQRPGLCTIDCVYGRGRFYNLGPRRHRDRRAGSTSTRPG